MPIDEKFHAVPHFKALINGIDTSSGQRDDSFFLYKDHVLGKTLFQYIKRGLSGSLFVEVYPFYFILDTSYRTNLKLQNLIIYLSKGL